MSEVLLFLCLQFSEIYSRITNKFHLLLGLAAESLLFESVPSKRNSYWPVRAAYGLWAEGEPKSSQTVDT